MSNNKTLEPSRLNPPLRVFSQLAPGESAATETRFGRPKLERVVSNRNVSGYFEKRPFGRATQQG